MIYTHTKCGGMIDPKKRQCLRCKRKWNRFSFWFDPSGIRPTAGEYPPDMVKPKKERQRYAKWAEGTPGARLIPSLLPNWPRWARILSTVLFITAVVLLSLWVFVWN